jgi:hypothetical protein
LPAWEGPEPVDRKVDLGSPKPIGFLRKIGTPRPAYGDRSNPGSAMSGLHPTGKVSLSIERLAGERLRTKSRADRVFRRGGLRVSSPVSDGLLVGEGFGLSTSAARLRQQVESVAGHSVRID